MPHLFGMLCPENLKNRLTPYTDPELIQLIPSMDNSAQWRCVISGAKVGTGGPAERVDSRSQPCSSSTLGQRKR